MPTIPGAGVKGRGGHDDGGRNDRGSHDADGSSKGTHLGAVSVGHSVGVGATMPLRTPNLAIGPRVNGLGAKAGFRALR